MLIPQECHRVSYQELPNPIREWIPRSVVPTFTAGSGLLQRDDRQRRDRPWRRRHRWEHEEVELSEDRYDDGVTPRVDRLLAGLEDTYLLEEF